MERVAGRIILGIEDAPLVDALIAWTARVDARIAADAAKSQHNKNAQPASAADYAQPA